MRRLTSRSWRNFAGGAGWWKLGLAAAAVLATHVAQAAPANDNFANATVIANTAGTIAGNNVGATLQPPCETNSIYSPDYGVVEQVGASVWYSWTAPSNGFASFDTRGSGFDTVLSVWTTTNGLCSPSLKNIATDDDSGGFSTSALTFQAVAGTVYSICVEGYDYGPPAAGNIVLNWSESIPPSSGAFVFATEATDPNTGLGLFTAADSDTSTSDSTTTPSLLGARVTVTRTNGAVGRAFVDYAVSMLTYTNILRTNYYGTNIFYSIVTTNGTFATNTTFNITLVSDTYGYYNADYTTYTFNGAFTNTVNIVNELRTNGSPVTGFPQTNRTGTAIETPAPGGAPSYNLSSTNRTLFYGSITNTTVITNADNSTFTQVVISSTNVFQLPSVVLTNVVYSGGGITNSSGTLVFDDFQMSQDVILTVTEAIGPDGSDLPYVPSLARITLSNPRLDPRESGLVPPTLGWTNSALINVLSSQFTTNSTVLNFDRYTYRVNEDEGTAVIWVTRQGGNAGAAVSVRYEIDTPNLQGNSFTLQAGSDYATPNANFTPVNGTLSWGANDTQDKSFSIPIINDGRPGFNLDMQLHLSNPTGGAAVGLIGDSTLTILNANQPAGAFDRTWNQNNLSSSSPPFIPYPGTSGNGGTVYAVVEQADGKAILAGSFTSFNSNPYNRIVRVLQNGYQDPSFQGNFPPWYNTGANDFIAALALQPDGKIIAVGNFTSYNGYSRFRIVRLNSDGSVDASFNPGLGADGMIWSVVLDSAGRIIIAGDFSTFNKVSLNRVARLNTDGSVDTSFNPGVGPDSSVFAVAVDSIDRVLIGGDFATVSGVTSGGVARLSVDGSLDTSFAPGIGTYNSTTEITDPVYALAVQPDGNIVMAGCFSYFDLVNYNGIVRLSQNGTLDLSFNPGTGTFNPLTGITDTIYALQLLQHGGGILIGGDFITYNGTRRVGIARLYDNGSLDTTFMDTAYNQFAGLINHYHNPDAINSDLFPPVNNRHFVDALAQEWFTNIVTTAFFTTNNGAVTTNFVTTTNVTGGNILIGGNFWMSGGNNQTFEYTNGVITPGYYRRDATLPRGNVARLIGGFTPGPGNIEFQNPFYTVAKDAQYLYVSLVRNLTNNNITSFNFSNSAAGAFPFTNNSLGDAQITVSVSTAAGGPGIAVSGVDYDLSPTYSTPTWTTAWETIPYQAYGWMYSQAVWGPNHDTVPYDYRPNAPSDVWIDIYNNRGVTGNLNANLKLSNPVSHFSLGGEVIPLGLALGTQTQSPMTIIEVNYNAGVLGFSSPTYTVVENAGVATITVTRTNGTQNTVQVGYATSSGSAINGIDFTNVAGTLTFSPGITSQTFTVPVIPGTTLQPDKTVNLSLYSPSGGAGLGLSDAVLTIVNNNFSGGHVSFTATNFNANELGGNATVSLSRLGGSAGTMSVTLFTTPVSAVPGVDYSSYSNTITWPNKLAFTTNILIPVFHDALVTSNRTVNLVLTNLTLNTAPTNKWGLITNATLTIQNVDSAGTVRFSSYVYGVKKYGGSALIPVVRPGGSVGTITVDYTTVDGTALAGVNYVASSGTLTFTNGQIGQFINVPIIDNGVSNGLQSLSIILTNASPSYALGSPSSAVLNIIDTASVNETPGSPDVTYDALGFNSTVYALALQANNQLVVGGDFTMANGVPRQRLARLNANGSLDPNFLLPSSAYGANSTIRAIAIQADGRILVGGLFTNFNSVNLNYIARLNYDGSLDSQFSPGSAADNAVYSLAETFVNGLSKILVGGGFANMGGYPINNFARLNSDGSIDTAFSTGLGPNGIVYAVAVQGDGKVLIGGDFTSVNGNSNFNHIARLNVDGSLDTTFSLGAGANGSVRSIAVQLDGKILLGGLFTSVNGNTNFNHVARLNMDGSLDSSFTPGLGASDAVYAIALQNDGRIILGGAFTQCSGVTRNGVTRLNPDGTVDPTINFGTGANSFVAAVVLQQDTILGYPNNVPDDKIIIGGGFTQYDGQPHNQLARIYGGSVGGVGAFEFSAPAYSAHETDANALITIWRTGGTSGTNVNGSGDILVPFYTSAGTAVQGINYAQVTNNIDFPEGEVVKTVSVPVLHDFAVMPDLSVNLALNPSPPAAFGDQPVSVLNIINDDGAIAFSAPTYTVTTTPVNGAAVVNIQRQGSVTGTSTALFSTIDTPAGGTSATPGTDYWPTNTLVTFNPGMTNVVVTVPIINNTNAGVDKTVALQLTGVTGAVLGSPSSAVLTIINTTHAPGQLMFATNSYSVSKGDTILNLTVLRVNGSYGNVSVNYATVPGTAIANTNFVSTNSVLTLSDGVTSGTISIAIKQNSLVQGPVTFSVVLSTNQSSAATLLQPSSAVVTILEDNAGLAFTAASDIVNETAGSLTLNVVRLYNLSNSVTVNYSTVDGTAKSNINYTAISGTLTFGSGQAVRPVVVPILYDTNVTGDLAFTIALSSPSAPAQLTPPSTVMVTVQDADAGLSFTNSAMTVLRTATNAFITVVCSNPNAEPLSVNYATADGTAVAGQDYTATSGTLVFSGGIATNSFPVPILNNSVVGNRSFTVSLSNPTAPGQLLPPSTQTVTIVDGVALFAFSNTTYFVEKTAAQAVITVVRTGLTNSTATVNYQTAAGTAVSGVNYSNVSGTLTFTNGVTSQAFYVPIIGTQVVQPDLTVLLQLLLNPSGGQLVPPNAAVLTIHDNTGSYVIPSGSALVSESGAGAPNGIIESNEMVTILFAFRDSGGTNVNNLIATLLATNGVTPVGYTTTNYGPLVYLGHSVSRPFSFMASGTNGQQIIATFDLFDGAKNIGTGSFSYVVGLHAITFSNPAVITINDDAVANPYPSTIIVSGFGGTVLKATATLSGLTHASPSDIEVLLVAPNQTDTLLMANAGGSGGNAALNNATIIFDDTATNSLPQFNQITNIVNRPTQYSPITAFPP